jgi:hypothetical protein
MEGHPSPARYLPVRKMVAVAIWLVFAAIAASLDRQQPENMLEIACFTIGSVGLALKMLWPVRPTGHRKRRKDVPVAIVVPIPRRSPGIQQCRQELPAYCQALLS